MYTCTLKKKKKKVYTSFEVRGEGEGSLYIYIYLNWSTHERANVLVFSCRHSIVYLYTHRYPLIFSARQELTAACNSTVKLRNAYYCAWVAPNVCISTHIVIRIWFAFCLSLSHKSLFLSLYFSLSVFFLLLWFFPFLYFFSFFPSFFFVFFSFCFFSSSSSSSILSIREKSQMEIEFSGYRMTIYFEWPLYLYCMRLDGFTVPERDAISN